MNKWLLGKIWRLQKHDEEKKGKEAKSVERIMAKLPSAAVALEVLTGLIGK